MLQQYKVQQVPTRLVPVAQVLLIVLVDLLLGLTLGPLLVNKVQAPRLNLAVDKGTCETSPDNMQSVSIDGWARYNQTPTRSP